MTYSPPKWHYLSGLPPHRGLLYFRWNFSYDRKRLMNEIAQGKVGYTVVEVAIPNKEQQYVMTPREWDLLRRHVRIINIAIPPHLCPKGPCYLVTSGSRLNNFEPRGIESIPLERLNTSR